MKLEIHIVQNFAPSNLNRDDTGSPKDCELGGVRRTRISSQCWKRSIRDTFGAHNLLPEAERAARTKRLVSEVGTRVTELCVVSGERATRAVTKALEGAGLKTDEKTDKTQYLLFLPRSAIDALAQIIATRIEVLAPDGEVQEPKKEGDEGKKPKGKSKKEKSEGKDAADPEVKKAVEAILRDGSKTPELALFGRMIADAPQWNVEAACQVAHAISTNRANIEFDFYTAVDDFQKDDATGADMMGTVAFNSSCFYRYLVVDTDELERNLGGGPDARDQARRTVAAFVEAAVLAIPTGKQNSMAAQNKPSLVLIDIRDSADTRSLANAFVEPVRPNAKGDLVTESVRRLGRYAASVDGVYGTKGRRDLSFIALDPEGQLKDAFKAGLPSAEDRGSLDALVRATTEAVFGATT